MLEFMGNKHPKLLEEIKTKSEINDELVENLKKALDEFKPLFQPTGQL